MLSRFLDSLTVAQRLKLANAVIYVISLVVIVVVALVLLELDEVWPQRLIPWVPVERL